MWTLLPLKLQGEFLLLKKKTKTELCDSSGFKQQISDNPVGIKYCSLMTKSSIDSGW